MKIDSYARFVGLLRSELELGDVAIEREARFIEDLGFDSLDLLAAAVWVEECYGIELPAHLSDQLLTVGGLYSFCCNASVTI